MSTVEEYFDPVRQLVQNLANAQTERYEEHLLSATIGKLRIRLRFSDNQLLEISEAFIFVGEVATHPDHKHSGEQILASFSPSIERLLAEVHALRKTAS
ncbi:MAG: hypothetical protein HY268_34605 [Deltaproteobacteria bacterium]|nr:hypothetical protein [Deltaproteobacteria bacterium]